MPDATTPTKYVFTLVKERNYDSDLGAQQSLGSVVLAVDTERIGDIEQQLLEAIRATGVLDDELAEEDDEDPGEDDYYDEGNRGATYSVEATPVIEVASVEAAAADLAGRNRWVSDLRQGR